MPDTDMPVEAEFVDIQPKADAIAAQQSYQLGRIGQQDPRMVVKEATEIANILADVITSQKLYTVIKNKKYVWVEGWSIIGAMMGVAPVEEYVKEIPKGYEAKIKLIRIRDEKVVGGASSICTRDGLWEDREEYAVRSMAQTRATSKAYRLSYGWIIKLAGFDPTPMDEAGEIAQTEAMNEYKQREAEQMKTITLVKWKEGILVLQGPGVVTFRAELSEASRKAIDLKLDDHDKVTYIKESRLFDLQDIGKKHGYVIKFAEEAST